MDALEPRHLLANPGLTLNILADSIAANAGPGATSGTVTRGVADVARHLTVTLTSSAPDAAAVPGSVVIPAGQVSASFSVDAVIGDPTPGSRVVTITGSAAIDGVFGRDPSFAPATLGFGVSAVTTQADGKIVAAGTYHAVASDSSSFAVQRYNADGTPDASFRDGGAAVLGKAGRTMTAKAVAVQPDGKIIVGGSYQDQGDSSWNMQLARLTADGQLDPSFGDGGWVSLIPTPGSYNEIWALAVAADGKILIGGNVSNAGTYADFAVVRLDPTGTLDATFGDGGYATTSFAVGGDRGFGLAVQPDGKILLAGESFGGNSTSNFAVARWTADGRLDPTFGSGGKVQTDVPGEFDQASGLALQADGKIVVAGSAGGDLALVRYTTSGALDEAFGAGGIVVKDLGGDDWASSVVVQGDGKIVVGGASALGPVSRFDANGAYLESVSGDEVVAMALQPGGRIVVAGAGRLDAYAGASLVTAVDTLTVIGARAAAPSAVWTQRGGDAGHTSYVDARIDASGIELAWSRPLTYDANGSWAQSGNRAVAIDEMHVYRTDLDGYWASGDYHIIAYDLKTGAEVWNQILVGNGPVSAPSVVDGKVYVNRSGHSGISGGTEDDQPWLYVLDARTGAIIRRQTYSAQWGSDERPAIEGDQLVAYDGYYGGFSAWTTSTLARRWNNPGPQLENPMAAFDSQYIYAYDNRVYSRSTGAQVGNVAAPAGMSWIGSPVVSDAGRLLFDVRDSEHYATRFGVSSYDAQTRTPLWTVLLPAAPTGKAVGDGVVAVVAGTQLILLDETTGDRIGGWDAPEALNPEIVLTRSHAFVQTSTDSYSRVYAINLATGRAEWSYENRNRGESGATFMEMAFGGGRLLLSHDAFVTAFAAPEALDAAPVAADDSFATAQGSSLAIAAPGLLHNDGDADGDSLTVALIGVPAHGAVALAPDGSFVYTPAPGFAGVDRFRYMTTDGRSRSNVATVTIVVDATPAAAGRGVSLVQGGSKPITLTATDPEGASLTYTVAVGPAHGTLSGSGPNLVYTPHAGYTGPDHFTFAASDGRSTSVPATVTILVKPALAVAWNAPAAIVYGTRLGSSQLNASANIAGAFVYTPAAGTVLGAGTGRVLTARFVPTDPDYGATWVQTRIDVLKATPTITWAKPAAITYGTPLGGSQLNAAASAPGAFRYSTAPGTILSAGSSRPLTAVFTPADPANYRTATCSTTIDVRKAVLTVIPTNLDMGRGDPVPGFPYAISGFVAGESVWTITGAPVLTTTATSSSAAGRYPITAAIGTLAAADYDFQFAPGVLTVHPRVLDVRVRWGSRSMSLLGLDRNLPFVNLTGIDVVFSDDVNPGLADLKLTSAATAGRSYGFSGVGFNPNTHTATWALPTALGVDRLMLALDEGVGARVDPAISTWPLGPVGFGVLPGDVDGDGRATATDQNYYRRPPAGLRSWMDLDGDGDVDRADRDSRRAPVRPAPPRRPPVTSPRPRPTWMR
ncbi:Ig-like domain-containing protein [Planctomyces sp. SH-PL62]|uniref:Ig-like domain-containing protein n=1 Tax=Planctomyces sp. SH-PL62 TaxID=1636152 RepID=UPI000838B0BD|nr:Ig-like domain-containing protein [Planctomyces sp. SH-PL62]